MISLLPWTVILSKLHCYLLYSEMLFTVSCIVFPFTGERDEFALLYGVTGAPNSGLHFIVHWLTVHFITCTAHCYPLYSALLSSVQYSVIFRSVQCFLCTVQCTDIPAYLNCSALIALVVQPTRAGHATIL